MDFPVGRRHRLEPGAQADAGVGRVVGGVADEVDRLALDQQRVSVEGDDAPLAEREVGAAGQVDFCRDDAAGDLAVDGTGQDERGGGGGDGESKDWGKRGPLGFVS